MSLLTFLTCCLGLSKAKADKLLAEKSVKVNDVRVSSSCALSVGDVVKVYDVAVQPLSLVYADQNVVVVDKPANLQIEDVLLRLQTQLNRQVFAVHRLDRNTCGLLVVALTEQAEQTLVSCFEQRKVDKAYYALVFNKPKQKAEKLKAYLFKDSRKSHCYVYDTHKTGCVAIETQYQLIATNGFCSLLRVKLITGRTHQIRAHLSHVGLPIVGDGKYGNGLLNKRFKLRYQQLQCCEMMFYIEENNALSYLSGKRFSLKNRFSLLTEQ